MILERHYGKIHQGKLYFSPRNIERYKNALKALEGEDFELSIRKVQKHATESQYSYYRKAIIGTCEQSEMFGGWLKVEIAKFFEEMFLSETIIKRLPAGTWTNKITRSVANLSTIEMSEFIEKVIAWLAQNNISIGSPEDYFHKS